MQHSPVSSVPRTATCHELEELRSPHVRCRGRTSSRSQGLTGGFSSPCRRPESRAMLGYFLRKVTTAIFEALGEG